MTQSETTTLRLCVCTGCSAPHHRTEAPSLARWYLALPAGQREEVCGTCANRRTTHSTRPDYLTPIAGLQRLSTRLVGREVAGLAITSVDAEDGVMCECNDPGCGCGATCRRTAVYQWGSVADDNWQYLCRGCCLRLAERDTAPTHGNEEADA